MKPKRQMRIIELVSQNIVTSQEELCQMLAEEGINVTQATISRDIKELNMVRVPAGDGRYKYALMPGDPTAVYKERFHRLFKDCCIQMDKSGNIVFVKTISGAAGAVGEAIDGLHIEGILGTVAGDNAVLVVAKDGYPARNILQSLRNVAGL